jgi:hypothetical protein
VAGLRPSDDPAADEEDDAPRKEDDQRQQVEEVPVAFVHGPRILPTPAIVSTIAA